MTQKAKIVIIWIPLFCLVVAIAIPNCARSRVVTAKDSCINRLRQIDGAKVQWAFMNHKLANDLLKGFPPRKGWEQYYKL